MARPRGTKISQEDYNRAILAGDGKGEVMPHGRMTLSEALRAALAPRGGVSATSSVELSRNAAGNVQIAVKVAADGEHIRTAEEARREARRIFEQEARHFKLTPPAKKPASPGHSVRVK